LVKSIRDAYSELVQSIPLEKLPDDVEFNDEFKMEAWIGSDHSKESFYIQKNEIANSKFQPVFEYTDIDPLDNYKCGIKTEDFRLPSDAQLKDVDPSCCINFDTKGTRNIFCSTEAPICALRVRQFARKIKIECLLKYHAMVYDDSKKPTPDQLKKVSDEEAAQGKFKGWGYYYSISNSIFRKKNPLYFQVDKQISVSLTAASDPQAVLKLRDLTFSCGEK